MPTRLKRMFSDSRGVTPAWTTLDSLSTSVTSAPACAGTSINALAPATAATVRAAQREALATLARRGRAGRGSTATSPSSAARRTCLSALDKFLQRAGYIDRDARRARDRRV